MQWRQKRQSSWISYQKMNCSIASNSGRFAWSGVGIGEGSTWRVTTFLFCNFLIKNVLTSGYFIAIPHMMTLRSYVWFLKTGRKTINAGKPHTGMAISGLTVLFQMCPYSDVIFVFILSLAPTVHMTCLISVLPVHSIDCHYSHILVRRLHYFLFT